MKIKIFLIVSGEIENWSVDEIIKFLSMNNIDQNICDKHKCLE